MILAPDNILKKEYATGFTRVGFFLEVIAKTTTFKKVTVLHSKGRVLIHGKIFYFGRLLEGVRGGSS